MSSPYTGSDFLNGYVIYPVAAVCLIFVLVAYSRIIKQHILSLGGAPLSWRHILRQPTTENNDDAPLSQLPTGGLASAVIHSLPAIRFREAFNGGGSHGNTDCAVCLGEFSEGEWLRLLPNCAHVFHVSCIDIWFRTHSTCPMCRTNALYDFTDRNSSVSMVAVLEPVRREDTLQERPLGYNILESETLRNPEFRLGTMTGHLFECTDSDESMVSPMVSPMIGMSNHSVEAGKLVHNNKGEPSSRDFDSDNLDFVGPFG